MRDVAPQRDPTHDGLLRYEEALAARDTVATVALIEQMLAGGAEPVLLLTNVIAASQRANGIRWQRGEWTVAEEHAATAMAMAATKVILFHARRTPTTRGPILVACAEREWHALPALMINCALRAHGWDTTLLGASTSPMRLNQHLQDIGPDAVAVSCSMLGALPTTRRFIEASTAAGVPVVVGGAAFGRDDVRARALGATAWASDAHGAVTAVQALPVVVSPAPPIPEARAGEQATLEWEHRNLVTSLREQWIRTSGVDASVVATPHGEMDVTEDVLNQIVHAVSAALLTDDPRPVSETSSWIAEVLRTRGIDGAQIRDLGRLLVSTLADYPLARELVELHFDSGLSAP